MPYIIEPRRAVCLLVAALAAMLVGAAPALAETTECATQPLSQPFLAVGDSNFYVLVPGESADDFEGSGWELSGGATVVRRTLADGTVGSVLSMPGGSKAVSPSFCVNVEYPTARTRMANLSGGFGYDESAAPGISFAVGYEGRQSWFRPLTTGQIKGARSGEWTVSEPLGMEPEDVPGWQRARITLTASGSPYDVYGLYDLYVDPYSR